LGTKYVIDINIMAIYLVENHPGYPYVSELIDSMISQGTKLILFDFLPFRVYWIMTSKWKIPKNEAADSISSFLNIPNVSLICLETRDILHAFKLAKELHHDVYDIVYLVLVEKTSANGIITTDTDFKTLCEKIGIEYINPVPKNILKKFSSYK